MKEKGLYKTFGSALFIEAINNKERPSIKTFAACSLILHWPSH
jgi:hypothetical protein